MASGHHRELCAREQDAREAAECLAICEGAFLREDGHQRGCPYYEDELPEGVTEFVPMEYYDH